MSGRTILVVGIAGVGKTTLMDRLISRRPELLHVRAGQLLAAAASQPSTEALRLASSSTIAANQEVLASAFEAFRRDKPTETIVFDGHLILDNDIEVVQVSLAIIRRLTPAILFFIEDAPEAIAARRSSDLVRKRPNRTLLELQKQQDLVCKLAQEYARDMGVPFARVTAGNLSDFESKLDELLCG